MSLSIETYMRYEDLWYDNKLSERVNSDFMRAYDMRGLSEADLMKRVRAKIADERGRRDSQPKEVPTITWETLLTTKIVNRNLIFTP